MRNKRGFEQNMFTFLGTAWQKEMLLSAMTCDCLTVSSTVQQLLEGFTVRIHDARQ